MMTRLAHHATLDLARAPDGEDTRCAKSDRRGDGRVLTEASIEVKLVVDANGWKQEGNRSARQCVLGADAPGAQECARGRAFGDSEAGGHLHEHHCSTRRHLGT